jgi:hypothetical protein
MKKPLLIFALLIGITANAQSFSDYELYQRKQAKPNKMTVTTKYSPGDFVFIIVGSGDNTKVYESEISAVNITAALSGIYISYTCSIDRTKIGTVVPGSPILTYVDKSEKNMYDTAEGCFQAIVILNQEREKQKNKNKNGDNKN